MDGGEKCLRPGLNWGPSVYKTDALPLSHKGGAKSHKSPNFTTTWLPHKTHIKKTHTKHDKTRQNTNTHATYTTHIPHTLNTQHSTLTVNTTTTKTTNTLNNATVSTTHKQMHSSMLPYSLNRVLSDLSQDDAGGCLEGCSSREHIDICRCHAVAASCSSTSHNDQ